MILLTGRDERDLGFAALREGATDALEKGKLDACLLERAMRYALQQGTHAVERERLQAAIREAERRKNQFLTALVHELRNPLVPIRNALEIMRLCEGRTEVVEKYRTMIERQVEQIVQLLDDLSGVVHISEGTIRLRKTQADLSEVIKTALESSRPLIERGGHQLTVRVPTEPVSIVADPARLSQIVRNLLNNAARYTAPGGQITLTAVIEADHLAIRVQDSGIGIPPEMASHIFETFTHSHENEARTSGGLGIGLFLVEHLARLHGGSVAVFSAGAGQGSEFTVRAAPERACGPERDHGFLTDGRGRSGRGPPPRGGPRPRFPLARRGFKPCCHDDRSPERPRSRTTPGRRRTGSSPRTSPSPPRW